MSERRPFRISALAAMELLALLVSGCFAARSESPDKCPRVSVEAASATSSVLSLAGYLHDPFGRPLQGAMVVISEVPSMTDGDACFCLDVGDVACERAPQNLFRDRGYTIVD